MVKAIVDGDWLVYAASFAGEKRSIKVTKKSNGKEFNFDNRTQFYGTKRKEIGGYLGGINSTRLEKGLEPYTKEDFLIEDVQTLKGPLPHILHTVKEMLTKALEIIGAEQREIYLGKGECFRVERSTVWKYKGQRDETLKPLLKADVSEYLIKHHGAEVVEEIEADDMLIIRSYKDEDAVVISHDKDALSQPVYSYNPNKPELGIQDGNQFGRLYLNDKNEVKGVGRLFFYFQCAYGDDVDHYRSNSGCPETKFGEKSVYDRLVGCKNDQEALQATLDVYKYLYPSPKEIIGWRGDTIEIDAMYMFRENWDMARMLRFEGDKLSVDEVLGKYGITF